MEKNNNKFDQINNYIISILDLMNLDLVKLSQLLPLENQKILHKDIMSFLYSINSFDQNEKIKSELPLELQKKFLKN
jgi:hypothetical protein